MTPLWVNWHARHNMTLETMTGLIDTPAISLPVLAAEAGRPRRR